MKQSEAKISTKHGNFRILAYANTREEKSPTVVLVSDTLDISKAVNVRIHSECMTGDIFGSGRCDCGEQLAFSMDYINENEGIVIYLRQEGRGIGLINKLDAYVKQDQGYDTAKANTILGLEEDGRTYEAAIEVLRDLEVTNVRLLTNNPDKINAFANTNITVVDRVAVEISPGKHNHNYLQTKKTHFGHLLNQV